MEGDDAQGESAPSMRPGPTLRSVLEALHERGIAVGEDDDGRRMSVDGGRGRQAWLAYGRVMRFESDPGSAEAFAAKLNALLATLPDEFAPDRWLVVGVAGADLAWQLERFGVAPGSYVLAVEAGLRDLHSIVARYGLPGPP
jgi:hypothetical protein